MDSYRVDAQDVAEGRPEALPADAAKEAQSAEAIAQVYDLFVGAKVMRR